MNHHETTTDRSNNENVPEEGWWDDWQYSEKRYDTSRDSMMYWVKTVSVKQKWVTVVEVSCVEVAHSGIIFFGASNHRVREGSWEDGNAGTYKGNGRWEWQEKNGDEASRDEFGDGLMWVLSCIVCCCCCGGLYAVVMRGLVWWLRTETPWKVCTL